MIKLKYLVAAPLVWVLWGTEAYADKMYPVNSYSSEKECKAAAGA